MSPRRALLLASFLLAFVPRPSAGIDWEIETVDTDGNAGYRGSLALDSQGNPHIVYMDLTSWDVRYATKTGATWNVQLVSHSGDYRTSATTVILPGDVPAFTREGRFAVRSGQGWVYEDMGGFSPWSSTVALGTDGAVHGMVQWSWGSGDYMGYVGAVRREETGWSYVELMETIFLPTEPQASMIVDAQGNPHMSMTTTSGDPLRYWHLEGGNWLFDELVPGTWSSIGLDAQGSPRISFYDPVAQDFVIASRSNNAWVMMHIDWAGNVGLHTSQVVRNGVSCISYYDQTGGDLMFVLFDGSQATITPVDVGGQVGAWTSLALDSEGRPHIAYQDVTNGALKYAVGNNSAVPTRKSTLGGVKALYKN